MPEFDFDEPIATDYIEEETSGSALGIIMENWKKIVAAIVAIIVIFFVYDFFVGSYVDVSIAINDLEGNSIANAQLKIIQGVNEIYSSSGALHNLKLRPGNYIAKISAPGFRVKTQQLIVERGKEIQQKILLEKDLKVRILSIEVPEQIIKGESKEIKIEIENNAKEAQQIELKVETAKNDKLEISGEKSFVADVGTTTKSFQLKVKDSYDVPSKGTTEKITFSIKYLSQKKEASIKILPQPEITLYTENFRVSSAGNSDSGKIRIRNNSRFKVENLKLHIEVVRATKNSKDKIKEWFLFTERQGNNKWEAIINEIAPRKTIEIPLRVDVPVTAKAESVVLKAVLEATFLEEPIEKSFNLEIEKEAELNAELKLSKTDYEIEIRWDDTQQTYPVNNDEYLEIYNGSNFEIENVRVSLACEWAILNEFVAEKIAPRERKRFYMKIEIPSTVAPGTEIECRAQALFDNPIEPGKKESISLPRPFRIVAAD